MLLYKYNFKELKHHTEKPLTVTPKEISHVPSDRPTSADRSACVASKARQMGVSFHRTLKEQSFYRLCTPVLGLEFLSQRR